MCEKSIYEFVFEGDGKQIGPVISCPCVKSELVVDYNYIKYYNELKDGKDSLADKFKDRLPLHKKVIDGILEGKSPAKKPYIKLYMSNFTDISFFKKMEDSHTLVLHSSIMRSVIPEKNNPLLIEAKKFEANRDKIISFNSICWEEQTYMYLKLWYEAIKLKLNLIILDSYIEIFQFIVHCMNVNKMYKTIEVYFLEDDPKETEEYVRTKAKNRCEAGIALLQNYRSIFEIIIHNKSFIIEKNPKIFKGNLKEYLTTKKVKKLALNVIKKDLTKVGGGKIRRRKVDHIEAVLL